MANDHIADDRKKVRLIDANALLWKLKQHHDLFIDAWEGFSNLPEKDKARVDEISNCIADVFNAPTVSAVEVCRCKDCKHFDRLFKGEGVVNKVGTCHLRDDEGIETAQSCDDFCSYGERRTE